MLRRYDERLAKYGDDIRTLGSGTEERRRLRFQVLREIGITPGCAVLDVGCGFGDFFGYLSGEGVAVDYRGIDINPRLLEIAQRKYPQARFIAGEFAQHNVEPVDFVVASGTFNLAMRTIDNYEYVRRALDKAMAVARRGVAMDFQTSYVDFKRDDVFYYQPERLLSIAKTLTKRVALRHDYPLYEFCLYLFPDFEGWAGSTETA